MKEVGRSVHSGDVVKRKSSSGCLIIKKKVVDGAARGQGFSDSSSRSLFNSIKEKKRPRVIRSDSESSDEFTEPYRRKIDTFHNGPVYSNRGFMENREFETERRVNNRMNEFQYDDYESNYDRRIRVDVSNHNQDYNHDHGLKLHYRSRDQMESGSGSSRMIDDRRRDFVYNNKSPEIRVNHGMKSRYKMEDDESHLPLLASHSKYREVSNEPIRLQGKNGVLKVMVNKNRQISVPHQTYDPNAEAENWKESRPTVFKRKSLNLSHKSYDPREAFDNSIPESSYKKKTVTGPSFHSDSKNIGKPIVIKSKKKSEPELPKPKFDTETEDDSNTPVPLKNKKKSSGVLHAHHSTDEKLVKSERSESPLPKKVTPVKGKETKVKRGSGTEKQLLREKIRSMLLGAGWTIDYRPRRNRDYLDAVYINPSGTAYWSIIKAYEALQKEGKDHSQVGGEFTPLPMETLNKLTRQTRKKIEREMKKKRKDEGSVEYQETTKKRILENSGDDSDSNSNDDYQKKVSKKIVQGRKSHKLGRCTLLIRNQGKVSENEKFVPYLGKRTIISWLIDSGTVELNEKVEYMNRRKTRIMLEGWITKEGIHCGCCSKILAVYKFELHAGSKLRNPFLNIFIQNGKSLMQCEIDAWNKQGELERKGFYLVDNKGDDPNDDTCGLCGDGGDLICCDGCPSTFHQSCLGIQMLPKGDWHCPNCLCKYCETASMDLNDASVGSESSLLVCCVCEKKYHESCSTEMDKKPIDLNDANLSFCGQKCQQLHSQLQKLIGVKQELDSGFSWCIIHRSDITSDISSAIELSQKVECNSKLAVALSVIDECFVPILDRRSGINLIHNVVYNCRSNFSRLNYSGFFTVILERGDEVISAASIRIHGTQLAEMPFIGTRHIYRRQGMCRRLLSAIESVLSSLHIEKLVIPAIAEHMQTWTGVFGFNPLEESHKREMRSINMLVFPGTDMLQKPIVHQSTSLVNIISYKDERSIVQSEPSSPTDSGSQDQQSVSLNTHSDSIPPKNSMQDGNETTDGIANSEVDKVAKFEVDAIANSEVAGITDSEVAGIVNSEVDGIANSEVAGIANSEVAGIANSEVDGAAVRNEDAKSTINRIDIDSDNSISPKESVSLEPQSDSKVEEIAAKSVDNISSDKPCELTGKESVSVSADSESNVEVVEGQNGKIGDAIPLETPVLNDDTAKEE